MITVSLSSVNIPILGLSADVESTKLIVPLFVISEESLANILVLSCPLISIVPEFVKVAFSPDIPTDLFPLNVKIPAASFVAVAFVAFDPALLFLAKIPVAPSPFKITFPLFRIVTFPSPGFPPNSFTFGLPAASVLYAIPDIPIPFFPGYGTGQLPDKEGQMYHVGLYTACI